MEKELLCERTAENLITENKNNFNLSELDNIKLNFMRKQNIYLNYLFYFINNHYESIINNANFFHFATEAVIWELYREPKYNNDKFNISCPLEGSIDTSSYCNNLKLLTGSSHHNEAKSKLTELQLAKLFLERFNFYRTHTSDASGNFNEIFKQIFGKTVSSCLKRFIKIIGNKETEKLVNDDLFFYEHYIRLVKSNNNITLIAYINTIEEAVQKKIEKNDPLMILIRNYYFFARTNFADYILDLELFYDHSISLFEKLKKYSQRNLTNLSNYVVNTKVYQRLTDFYHLTANQISVPTDLIKTNLTTFKVWVNDSIHYCPNSFIKTINATKLLVYDKIIAPSRNFLVLYTDKSATFILTNLHNVEIVLKEVSTFMFIKAEEFLDSFQDQFNQKDLFIRFTTDDKINYLKVDIDNSVVMFNPQKFKEYVRNTYERLSELSLRVYEDSKHYLMDSYKGFLKD
jgi:hypothetical protein